MLTDEDIGDVIKTLGHDDLQKLYGALGLSRQQVQKIEDSSQTRDVDLKARDVLEFWRKEYQQASHDTILEALNKCDNRAAKEQLERTWNITGGRKSRIGHKKCNILLN